MSDGGGLGIGDLDPTSSVIEKLKVALNLVETLRSENHAYKDNFDCLKNSHDRLQDKHADLTGEYEISAKEKAALEAQNSELQSYFKTQLDERTQELEAARARIPHPKDLELLRLKTVQAVQDQNEKRWKGQNKDVEKYRNLYYSLRQDHELAKADIDRERAQLNSKLKEMEASYGEEMAALETRMLELRTALETTSDTRRSRELQRDNADLQLKVSSMVQELEELRAEKEKLRLDLEQASRLHKRTLTSETALSKSLQAEKDALAVRITAQESEMAQTLRTLDQLTEANADLTKELDKTRSRMEEVSHRFKVEMSDTKLASLKQHAALENVIGDLTEKFNVLESQSKKATETIHGLRERITGAEKDTIEKCRQAREEEWAARAQLEAAKSDLETRLSNLTHDHQATAAAHMGAQKELQTTLTSSQRALRELQAQHERASHAAIEGQAQVERLTSQIAELEGKVKDKEAGERAADAQRGVEGGLRLQIATLEKTLNELRERIEQARVQMESDRDAYAFELDRFKKSWTREKQVLTQRLDTALADQIRHSDKVVELEDLLSKSQELYKQKTQGMKARAKEYKDEIARLRRCLDIQTRRADAVAREINQRQTDFLGLLRNEGIVEASA
ncbi:Centrosomal protein of 83 kDa [Thoreauomyces humboldtii]|nr:Centrosomal protein of 83 kDa [Thoreauomyces humboldtii]